MSASGFDAEPESAFHDEVEVLLAETQRNRRLGADLEVESPEQEAEDGFGLQKGESLS